MFNNGPLTKNHLEYSSADTQTKGKDMDDIEACEACILDARIDRSLAWTASERRKFDARIRYNQDIIEKLKNERQDTQNSNNTVSAECSHEALSIG